MELKDFVAETLKQIIDGVKTAQEHAELSGASVNPQLECSDHKGRLWGRVDGLLAQEVEFDVAVTVTEGKESKGGLAIFVGPVGVGAQGKSDTSASSVSRIKFSIPMLLPRGKTTSDSDDQ